MLVESNEAELREVLNGLTYPADKVHVVSCAGVHDFETPVRRRLHELPERTYASSDEVMAALSPQKAEGADEHRA
ncbi:DUF2795 domain-containing protein [Lentzea sp. NBC_00516]|uniref:DUF2795 domain-containing protein n=1 Tax=Lentzea sp. NBC_00516 TaxID=2903582 RepID=UPI002E81A2BA|nr:DUF2795 domain-containing protein [Lentzea sp. NBC_00516]WUD27473.1 DUF2795 domain-containing protein [Lentzea sp. NBC_00516]